MNILLVNTPSRQGGGAFALPVGLLYVGSVIERYGHTAKILDPYLGDEKLEHFDDFFAKFDTTIESFKPNIIGYSGIATSYGRAKTLSEFVDRNYPHIIQIAGGPLASTYDLLLRHTHIDVVFHGEAETSLPFFLERVADGKPFSGIAGTSIMTTQGIVRTEMQQIENLDSIPLPSYHLVDVNKYLQSTAERLAVYGQALSPEAYASIAKIVYAKTRFIPIFASRGCTHKCLFCHRNYKGIRRHSVDHIIAHMKYLVDTYDVSGFFFNDELFNSDYNWVMSFCDAIEKNSLDICYVIFGARVDKVDKQMLQRLKETGCIEISYGQESGSDTILKELRKGATRERNTEITLLTQEMGLMSGVQVVVGSPSETTTTIKETIQFLKDTKSFIFGFNYLIPLPETPIWEYVQAKNLIPNVEDYLNKVAALGGAPLVNLTQEPARVWSNWGFLMHRELRLYYYRTTKSYYAYLFLYLRLSLAGLARKILSRRIRTLLPKRLLNLMYSKLSN